MTWRYAKAGSANVALIGALPRRAVLGLGFGGSAQAAATLAISSLTKPFAGALDRQIADWSEWFAREAERASLQHTAAAEFADRLMLSSMVVRAYRDKTYSGAMIASLSVPRGQQP